MDASDVMARVKAILEETFQEPVFVDRLPKDFKRPSFALELQKTEMADLNLFLVRKTTTVLITGFVDVDYYHDSSREELGLRQDPGDGSVSRAVHGSGRVSSHDRSEQGNGRPGLFRGAAGGRLERCKARLPGPGGQRSAHGGLRGERIFDRRRR